MFLNDLFYNSQADPASFHISVMSPIEFLKDSYVVSLGDTYAVVFNIKPV